MRPEDDFWRIWIFLAVYALVVLGFSAHERLTLPPVQATAPGETSSQRQVKPPAADEGWLEWGDKVGSIAGAALGAVALWAALVQLPPYLAEQRRVQEDLRKQSFICIGSTVCRRAEATHPQPPDGIVKVAFARRRRYSAATYLVVHVHNTGDKTARDLSWRFVIPPLIEVAQPAKGKTSDYTFSPASSGPTIVTLQTPFLHPMDGIDFYIGVSIPRGTPMIEVRVLVYRSNEPGISKQVRWQVQSRNDTDADGSEGGFDAGARSSNQT